MSTRRDFLKATATSVAAIIGWEIGDKLFAEKPTYVTPEETDAYYQVTCQEITDGEVTDRAIQAVRLGINLPLREVSWSTRDINLVPDVGVVLQIEQTAGVSPDKKIGTLDGIGLKVDKFRVRVISVTEIK